jgi:hypothetical protein
MNYTKIEACELADEIYLNNPDGLTDKEMDFLDSLYEWKYSTLTEKQFAWLKSIYTRLVK